MAEVVGDLKGGRYLSVTQAELLKVMRLSEDCKARGNGTIDDGQFREGLVKIVGKDAVDELYALGAVQGHVDVRITGSR